MNNLQKYINHLKRKDLALNTVKNYCHVVQKYLQKNQLLNTSNLKNFIQTGLKTCQPSTCRENLSILVLYAKYCQIRIKKETITRIIPKFQQKFFPTINESELIQLKTARFEKREKFYQRNNLLLDFLFYTGLRVSEIINLKHSDWNDNSLRIHGKGNKIRQVLLPPFLLRGINPYSRNYLFTNYLGNKLSARVIQKVINKRTLKAGIKKRITPHTFRRSFATLLNKRECPLTTIQKLLGHSQLQTTVNYIHNDYDTLYADYSKLWRNEPNINSYAI